MPALIVLGAVATLAAVSALWSRGLEDADPRDPSGDSLAALGRLPHIGI